MRPGLNIGEAVGVVIKHPEERVVREQKKRPSAPEILVGSDEIDEGSVRPDFAINLGAPFTGASVNPARSLAPAIVGGEFGNIWVYLAGPAAGAVLAWVLYKFIVTGDTDLMDDIKDMG